MLASATGATASVSLSEAFCLTSVPRIERSPWMSVWNLLGVLLDEPVDRVEGEAELVQRRAEVAAFGGEVAGHLGELAVEQPHLARRCSSASVVNFCRLRTVPNRSPRLLASVWAACESLVMLLPSAAPLPLRLAALTSSRALSAPFLPPLFAPVGPSATDSLFSAE